MGRRNSNESRYRELKEQYEAFVTEQHFVAVDVLTDNDSLKREGQRDQVMGEIQEKAERAAAEMQEKVERMVEKIQDA